MSYNLLDLQSAVLDDLKDPSFSTSRITRYLNYAQLWLFSRRRFRFSETSVQGSLTVGEYTYDQQSDHLSTIGGVLVDPVTTTNRWTLGTDSDIEADIIYLPQREFFARYPDPSTEANNRPSHWTEAGSQIYFSCPVDKAYVFTQRYHKRPATLSAGTDVPDTPEEYRELLELYALYRSEKYRGNHDVAATYKQDFEDGVEDMGVALAGVTSLGPTVARQTRVRYEDGY